MLVIGKHWDETIHKNRLQSKNVRDLPKLHVIGRLEIIVEGCGSCDRLSGPTTVVAPELWLTL